MVKSVNKNLSKLQISQLQILHEFVSVCEKMEIRYFLVEGTMLGAKRHQGFIPWDDDIDVAMPRKDYEKFRMYANNFLGDSFHLSDYEENNHYWMTSILYKMDAPVILQNASENVKSYVWIDVIPLDGAPHNKLCQKLHYAHFYLYRMLFQLSYFEKIVNVNRKRPFLENVVITILKHVKIEKLIDGKRIARKLHEVLTKYNYDDSVFVASYISDYKLKEIMPRQWYGEGKDIIFEDIEVKGVQEPEKYLKKLYNDYMRLPSKEKRIGKHSVLSK